MKTKTIDALEQALADMGADMTPRRADEFTSLDMHQRLGGTSCIDVVQRKLRALVRSGAYSKRQFGRDVLYRKVDTRAKTR